MFEKAVKGILLVYIRNKIVSVKNMKEKKNTRKNSPSEQLEGEREGDEGTIAIS